MKHTVTLTRAQENIPTYIPKPPVALPMFFEKKPYQGATGRLYPLPYSDGITDEKKDVSYEVYTLENEYIQTKILPAIGGKILSGYDKVGSYDFIYRNHVIKPALVGLAGAWISGVENRRCISGVWVIFWPAFSVLYFSALTFPSCFVAGRCFGAMV